MPNCSNFQVRKPVKVHRNVEEFIAPVELHIVAALFELCFVHSIVALELLFGLLMPHGLDLDVLLQSWGKTKVVFITFARFFRGRLGKRPNLRNCKSNNQLVLPQLVKGFVETAKIGVLEDCHEVFLVRAEK